MNWALLLQALPSLISAALQAVQVVEEVTGKPQDKALEDVINHLTPGQPNAPALK